MKNITFSKVWNLGRRGGLREGRGWGEKGNPISKFPSQLLLNGGPIAHRKFQHSSAIRKCLKIEGTDLTFGDVEPPSPTPRGGEGQDLRKKSSWKTVNGEPIQKISALLDILDPFLAIFKVK